MVNPSHVAPVNPTQTKIDTFFPGQSASPRASPRPGALASRPVNSSPQKSCAESSGQIARESTKHVQIVEDDGDDSDFILQDEEGEDEEVTGKKRKPTSSEGKKAKAACTKGRPGAWGQSHPERAHAVGQDGKVLSFDAHFDGLDYLHVSGLDFPAIARSVNGIADAWNNDPSSKGTFFTHSGTKGMSSQGRGPSGGAAVAFDKPGLRKIKDAIKEAGGRLGTYRFMPGDGTRAQDSHADSGRNTEESRMLISCDVFPGQTSASLNFTQRQDPAEHPRRAALVPDPTTGKPLTRVYPKQHATCVIGDGVAFGRRSGMLHEVVPAPAAPGGGPAGNLTVLVDIAWPKGATREERLGRQKDLAARLAAVKDADPATPNYATGLQIPRKDGVDASSLSASNTAYNNMEIQLRDGTTTTNASINANSCNVAGCSCTESGEACSCDGHVHVKNASVGGRATYSGAEKGRDKNTNELKSEGALNSGPGYGGVGKPFNSGHGATARDFSAEGANDAWYGLHLDIPKKDLAAKLRLLVQPDGSLKDAPLCDTEVNPDHPGLTKRRWTFGLDREGALILGVHNSHNPNRCVGGGTIPVTTAAPPYRVPHFAIAPLLAGEIVSTKTHNKRENKLAKLNEE